MTNHKNTSPFPQTPFIVLPTYNEKENIADLIEQILQLGPNYRIVVVDDDSPDGTYTIVENIKMNEPRVFLLHRIGVRGRGTAGIDGFKKALELGADAVVEMDADFSHQPRYIPQLLSELHNYDLVIGSRMARGGGETGRPLSRQIITKMASFFIRTWLRVPVKDPTSGFRAFRKDALEKIPFEKVMSEGPSIVEELLFYAKRLHFKIKEIPIIFEERYAGTSTLNNILLLKTLLFVLLLPFKIRVTFQG